MSPISSSPADQFLRHLLAVVVAAQCLLGCATLSPQAELRSQAAVRVAEVPFVAQAAYQCGPAALAMLLQHADVQVAADELTPSVYLPERRGSLQAELIAAAQAGAPPSMTATSVYPSTERAAAAFSDTPSPAS